MDNRTPIQSIARYVVLYRARHVKPYQWDAVADTMHRQMVELTRSRHRLLRASHAVGRALHNRILGVDELAASAVAFVLVDDGQPPPVVKRFALPDEQLNDDDPRAAMLRALAQPPRTLAPQWTMGIMLKAWGAWTSGDTLNVVTWREDAPIPRVSGWPAFAIPTPKDDPQ